MRGYHAIASMLRVDRSDDCIWLVDERDSDQSIHMTPDQATAAGKALMEAGGSSSNSLSLPIATRLADISDAIVMDVVEAGLKDWLLRKKQSPPPKDYLQLAEEQIALLQGEKAGDQSLQSVQEGVGAMPRELRRRFPKRTPQTE